MVAKEKLTKEGIPRYFKPHRSPVTSKDNCSHPANQDVRTRNQDTSTNTKDTKNQNRVEEKSCPNSKDAVKKPLSSTNGVENLTHRAADLSISAKQPKPLSLRQEVEVRRSPRIRAKRVRSVLDEVREWRDWHYCHESFLVGVYFHLQFGVLSWRMISPKTNNIYSSTCTTHSIPTIKHLVCVHASVHIKSTYLPIPRLT